MFSSYALANSAQKAYYKQISVTEISNSGFKPASVMTEYNSRHDKYLDYCNIYRGEIASKNTKAVFSIIKTKRKIKFVEWYPTGLKCGIN